MQDLPNGGGGGGRTPSHKCASRVGLCGREGDNSGGVIILGGGGQFCKHWPPGAGDPRYTPLRALQQLSVMNRWVRRNLAVLDFSR